MKNTQISSSGSTNKTLPGAPADRQRIIWIDALKGFAILTVVYMHNIFPESPEVYSVPLRVISAFHMTLFFMAAGFFYQPFKQIKFTDFIKRKAKTLLLPYFIWGVVIGEIVFNLRSILGTSIDINLKNDFINILLGKKSELSSWFIIVLFDIYLIEYLISRTACRLFKKNAYVIVFQLIINLGLLALGYFGNFPVFNVYRLNMAFLTCSFFFFGCLIRLFWDKCSVRAADSAVTGTVLVAVGCVLSFVNDKVSLFNGHFGKPWLTVPVALMINYGLFCVFRKSEKISGNPLNKLFVFFGQNSIIVLLTHKILIYGLRVVEKLLHIPSHTLNPVLATVIVIIIQIPVIYVFSRWLPFLFGKEKTKKD